MRQGSGTGDSSLRLGQAGRRRSQLPSPGRGGSPGREKLSTGGRHRAPTPERTNPGCSDMQLYRVRGRRSFPWSTRPSRSSLNDCLSVSVEHDVHRAANAVRLRRLGVGAPRPTKRARGVGARHWSPIPGETGCRMQVSRRHGRLGVGSPIDGARSRFARRQAAEVATVAVDDREAGGIARLDAEDDLLGVW